MSFSTFVKNELKQLATKEKDIDYKRDFYLSLQFFEKTPYMLLKNLVANKISINTANDDLKNCT